MMYCEITPDPIVDFAELMERVRSDSDGAVILFTGVVRDHHEGRSVAELRYETYEEMARSTLQRICGEVSERFEIGDVAVIHRVGALDIGETSVAIAVAAPHRETAYQASREIIERLKSEVPIWKKERYTDGAESWVQGARPEVPESPG